MALKCRQMSYECRLLGYECRLEGPNVVFGFQALHGYETRKPL
jgi:hypothetical protein